MPPSTGYSNPGKDLETAGTSDHYAQHSSTVRGETDIQVLPVVVDTYPTVESQVAGANNERSELFFESNKLEGSQKFQQDSPSLDMHAIKMMKHIMQL